MRIILVLVICSIMAACSSPPLNTKLTPFPESGKAVIYHFRVNSFAAANTDFQIANKKGVITTIENGSFYREVVEPGEHNYLIKEDMKAILGFIAIVQVSVHNIFQDFEERFKLDVEPDKIYYIHWFRHKTELVDENFALKEMRSLKSLNL